MIPGLPLGFAQPLMLIGLLSLPILWWILRLIPPQPRRIDFPPTRLLFDIQPKEETPRRTPWWLTLLRLTLATLVILAAASPLWNPPVETATARGQLALLIDDGYPTAGTWEARMRSVDDLIARAETDNRGVALIPLSEPSRDISFETPAAARVRLKQIKPKPYAIERSDMLVPLGRFLEGARDVELVWLSDGVDLGGGNDFVAALGRLAGGRPTTVIEGGLPPAHALAGAENTAGALTVRVLRTENAPAEVGVVRGLDLKGLPLGEATFAFKENETESAAEINIPVEIRNDIARLEISAEHSAGAVTLLDKRWRRRSIGVVTGATFDSAQPLLGATYYLSRALGPFADVRLAERGSPAQAVGQFIEQRLPMMILADVGNVAEAKDQLSRWIEDGGVLVRFAGPRLAAGDDEFVPVKLRRGGRVLGGALSWDQPQMLAPFPRESPFFGMAVPPDVLVNRQVLAEPDATLSERTWATLTDGTPLVTAQRRGKGMVVLFHITADTRWSDLTLSGTFVDMLKRIVALAGTLATPETQAPEGGRPNAREVVPPTRILDGFGVFGPPPPGARPVAVGYTGRGTADNPPGFYGPPEALLAVNTLAPADKLAALDFSALNARKEVYRMTEPQDLRAPVLLAALALLALDAIVVFWLAGGFRQMRRRPQRQAAAGTFAIAFAVLSATLCAPSPVRAQDDQAAMKSSLNTRLAFVMTGDAEVDRVTKAGLQGLTLFLAQRTALEAGDPVGLDPARDELAFYPLIYWPVVPGAAKPSREALEHIDSYMKNGGTVLFDTRDAIEAIPGADGQNRAPGMVALRNIIGSLDIPDLEPVPKDHVLTKTFYLLKDFPGRYAGGQLWVEASVVENEDEDQKNRPARAGDGVSSIIITSNDFAGAWAIRPDGQAMLPIAGGEARQREFAFRSGVNIVMYTLTGNYKADQVHVPALLERLGQ